MQRTDSLKRPWCWERLRAGGEGDNRGWDGWMASLTQWTWVWVNSGSWWCIGRPGVLQSMGSQRVGHDWSTELNWTKLKATSEYIEFKLPSNIDFGFVSIVFLRNSYLFLLNLSKSRNLILHAMIISIVGQFQLL